MYLPAQALRINVSFIGCTCTTPGSLSCANMHHLTLIRQTCRCRCSTPLAGFRFTVQPPRLGLHQTSACVSRLSRLEPVLVFCLPPPKGTDINSVAVLTSIHLIALSCAATAKYERRYVYPVAGGGLSLLVKRPISDCGVQRWRPSYSGRQHYCTCATCTNKPPAACCKGVHRA